MAMKSPCSISSDPAALNGGQYLRLDLQAPGSAFFECHNTDGCCSTHQQVIATREIRVIAWSMNSGNEKAAGAAIGDGSRTPHKNKQEK